MDRTPAQTLADLLESASSEDRRAITGWLLERPGATITQPSGIDMLMHIGATPIGPLGGLTTPSSLERLRGTLAPGEDSQLVTLRLPQERHAQLRQWCGEHDFSMAAVIRGLVEQFLESQAVPGTADEPA